MVSQVMDSPAPGARAGPCGKPGREGRASTPRSEEIAALLGRVQRVCGQRTIAEVARLTGIHQETTRRYLNGANMPSPAFLGSLVRALGVSGSWLLTGEGEMFGDPRPRRSGKSVQDHAGQLERALRVAVTIASTLKSTLDEKAD